MYPNTTLRLWYLVTENTTLHCEQQVQACKSGTRTAYRILRTAGHKLQTAATMTEIADHNLIQHQQIFKTSIQNDTKNKYSNEYPKGVLQNKHS